MSKVIVTSEVDSKIDLNKIHASVEKILDENGHSDAEASVTIVSHSEIVNMAVTYMNETREEASDHPVLSFLTSEIEENFVLPPNKQNYLGEVYVSYENANGNLEKIIHWAEHGALHLMGMHHD